MKSRTLAQPHSGLAKGPILVAHQTGEREKLGLDGLRLAETTAAARKHRLSNGQGAASERQEAGFGRRTSRRYSRQQRGGVGVLEFSVLSRGGQQSQSGSSERASAGGFVTSETVFTRIALGNNKMPRGKLPEGLNDDMDSLFA